MPSLNSYYSGPASGNFDGLRFFNPGQPDTDRSIGELLRWKWEAKAAAWPRHVPVQQAVPDERVPGLRVTTVGHATMLIQADGLNVLTDPLWAERAGPLSFAGPRRVTAPGVAFGDLPPIDVVLLSPSRSRPVHASATWAVPGIGEDEALFIRNVVTVAETKEESRHETQTHNGGVLVPSHPHRGVGSDGRPRLGAYSRRDR